MRIGGVRRHEGQQASGLGFHLAEGRGRHVVQQIDTQPYLPSVAPQLPASAYEPVDEDAADVLL